MYNNDYFIGVDENGQPYIAHAYATDNKGSNYRQGIRSGFKAGVGQGIKAAWGSLTGRMPKYKEKVKTKSGKWRYIYDETVSKGKNAAKKAWGSKAGRFIDEHDAGISEEILRRRAKMKSRQAFKKGDAASGRSYAHKAAELRDEAKSERQAAKEMVRKYGSTALSKIKSAGKKAVKAVDDIGIDDYIRMRKAQKNRPTNRTELEERKAYEEAYKNTWLGKRTGSKKKK